MCAVLVLFGILGVPLAAAGEVFAGVELGSTFSPSGWMRASSDAYYYRPVTVGGVEGVVAPHLCGNTVDGVVFMTQVTNFPLPDSSYSYSADPRQTSARAYYTLRDALLASGYSPLTTSDATAEALRSRALPASGFQNWRRAGKDGGEESYRVLTDPACQGVTAPGGADIVACKVSLVLTSPTTCTAGL